MRTFRLRMYPTSSPAKPNGTLHLVIFALIAAALVFATYREYQEESRVFREGFQQQISDVASLKVNQSNAWIHERRGDAEVAERNSDLMPVLQAALQTASGGEASIEEWLEAIRTSYRYTSAVILDARGSVRFAAGPQLMDAALYRTIEQDAAATTEPDTLFRYYPKGKNVVRSHFIAAAPLRSPRGSVIGAVVFAADPWVFPFPEILKWPSSTRSGKIYMVQRVKDRVRIATVREKGSEALPEEMSVDMSNSSSVFVHAVRIRDGVFEGTWGTDQPLVGVVKPMNGENEPVFIVATMDRDEAYQTLAKTKIVLALGAALLIALCGGGIGWMWRQQVIQSWLLELNAERERRALIGHYDYLTRFANDAIFLADSAGAIVQVNERATDFYGYSREEFLRMHVHDFRIPGTERDYAKADAALERDKSVVFETRAPRKDGSDFPVESSIRIVTVDGAQYRQTIIRDISERLRSQRQIDRLNRLYAVLSRCGQAIVRAQNEASLFREVAEIAVNDGGFARTTIRVNAPSPGGIPTVAVAGVAAGSSGDLLDSADATAEFDSRVHICNDLREATEYQAEFRNAAARYNIHSLLRLPIWRGGRVAGEMRLFSSEPGFFNESETRLAVEVAESLSFALESFRRKRKQEIGEAALRESRERLELVLDATEEAYWDWDLENEIAETSPRYDLMLGYAPNEIPRGYQGLLALLHPEDAARLDSDMPEFFASGKDIYTREFRMRAKTGNYIWVLSRGKVVRRTPSGQPARMVGTLTDVTARKELEEEFRQAQKIESVGRLAGGIAHDFNNLLTVINGYSQLLLTRFPQGDPRRKQITEIRKAGERASELTRQLLTFSRKNVSEPQLIGLNAATVDCETMLRRLTPANIEFTTLLEASQDEVVIDPSQVQQVLMNLVINACDAMSMGGRLTVRTLNVEIPAGHSSDPGGSYIVLEVEDTGSGMDEETLRHIFEPFFTTKEVGKGTGLGLSTVYGIVQSGGGFIRVHSVPGQGTTFRVFFPVAAEGILQHSSPRKNTPRELRGFGTILVVEDSDIVRGFTTDTLREYGYSVLPVRSGPEAIATANAHEGRIDLLLTDVIMPGMNGRSVAAELSHARPGLKVLFMSGYANDELTGSGERYIQKPFSPEALATAVAEVIGRSASSRTILVVEDEESVRGVFQEYLGRNHRLLLAANGVEALRMLRGGGPVPDLVITDLVMPDMEGVEIIRRIRQEMPTMRIIAMSGAFGGAFMKTPALLGADATLVKPIRPEILDQVVEDVLCRVHDN